MLERDCPKGQEPIVWYLVTNEPIDTAEQVAEVVDAYRARWVIEEFFKALKTGCQIEKRQMESYEALRIALALFLPIAVRLLALCDAARTEPEQACSALTARQLLRTCGSKTLSATPTNTRSTWRSPHSEDTCAATGLRAGSCSAEPTRSCSCSNRDGPRRRPLEIRSMIGPPVCWSPTERDVLRLVLRGLRRGLILHGPAVAPPRAAGRSSPSTYCVFARYFFAAALTRSDPTLSTNESKSRIPFGSSPNAYALLSSRSQ